MCRGVNVPLTTNGIISGGDRRVAEGFMALPLQSRPRALLGMTANVNVIPEGNNLPFCFQGG